MNPPAASSSTPSVPRSARRWHTHGWNRPLSWELILKVAPRLPRLLRVPVQHAVTAVCFAVMRRERAAVRRNLQRATGATGVANLRLAWRTFYNFATFLVAYTELKGLDVEAFRHRLSGADETERAIVETLGAGRGAVIMTMHIGHWDLGLKLLSRFEVPVHAVMLTEDPAEVARYADEARAVPRLTVHQMGSSRLLAIELMSALRRGEIVAVQADRPVGESVMPVPFFGKETPLPTGPALLAMATGAPLLPVFVLHEGLTRYRLLALPALTLRRGRDGDARGDARGGEALREAMVRVAGVMESVVRRYPDQWFNFYDVWPADD